MAKWKQMIHARFVTLVGDQKPNDQDLCCYGKFAIATQTNKVRIFWEGHKILGNFHLTIDCVYCSQKLGEDFAKVCGLLRINELSEFFSWW